MWMAAALFSSLVKYTTNGGQTWTNVVCGDVHYSHAISGIGSSGIATRSLSFRTPHFAYPTGQITLNTGSMTTWIELSVLSGIKFFVDTRSLSNGIYTVNCVDSTALLDTPIDTASWEATPPPTGERHVTPAEINDKLSDVTGGMEAALPLMPTQEGVPLNLLKGKTFQQLLTDLSAAAFGFYKASTSGFEFVSCKPTSGAHITTSEYAYIDDCGTFTHNGIFVEADEEYVYREGIPINTYTLTVGGTFANYVDTSYFSGIEGFTYQEWRCANAKVPVIPEIGQNVGFIENPATPSVHTDKRVTSVNVRWVGQTMVASLAGTIPENGELNRQSRYLSDVEEKVEQSKTYGGNMMITPYQGIIYLEEDAQEEGGGT